jgi:ribosome maturation factor RimP
LDVYDPIESRYLLEVASPGINRPLLKLEHFEAFLGQRVKVRTHAARNGSKSFVGKLVGVTPTGFEIDLEDVAGGRRETFGFQEVRAANYEHDFDEGKRRSAARQSARS